MNKWQKTWRLGFGLLTVLVAIITLAMWASWLSSIWSVSGRSSDKIGMTCLIISFCIPIFLILSITTGCGLVALKEAITDRAK